MGRAWSWCVIALCWCGCQSGEEPVRGAHQGVEPTAVYREAPPERRSVDAPVPEPSEPPVIVELEEEKPTRDLAAELRAAIGIPADCVRDFEAPRETTIRIQIGAVVRPTGLIIEPTAYGAGLSEAARRCLEERVGLVVLDPLDGEISQKVSTTIEIEYEPPVIVESDPGTPEPHPQDVVEPLPKRPAIAPSGTPIQEAGEVMPIEGGKSTERPIQGPPGRKITGPKPVPIDGYEVDENAQSWR